MHTAEGLSLWKQLDTDARAATSLMIYVEDVDAVYQRAIDAGATEVMPVQDHFYGDRSGSVEDPFGHRWTISTHVEDVPPDELERRAKEMMSEL